MTRNELEKQEDHQQNKIVFHRMEIYKKTMNATDVDQSIEVEVLIMRHHWVRCRGYGVQPCSIYGPLLDGKFKT